MWDGTGACDLLYTPSVEFQSTHPVWDGTAAAKPLGRSMMYFNPPIPCGMGPLILRALVIAAAISIHPSRVGWDSARPIAAPNNVLFQSTHPVWDGTGYDICGWYGERISIHPSRVGWDCSGSRIYSHADDFNPPIPCGMGPAARSARHCARAFQSTHPVWDGTNCGQPKADTI